MSRLLSFTDRLQLLLALMVAPHSSLLLILVNHYLRTLHEPVAFLVHLCVSYTLTSYLSLPYPGPVCLDKPAEEDNRISTGRNRLCRKCWAPKPERTHHCSLRKMRAENGGKCVVSRKFFPLLDSSNVSSCNLQGHRTYPSFFHFITCITLFSAYVTYLAGTASAFLSCAGVIFGLVVGSFMVYHIYLISYVHASSDSKSITLLTTEIPSSTSIFSLVGSSHRTRTVYTQRRLVRNAHRTIKLKLAQVFGWRKPGGDTSLGDGRSFPRNPRAHDMLQKLAGALETADKEA
ncbi:zf-DHHC-domain-containing protein [Pisolithus microcarpus]|nr:zf-DHHC-domain-containing protein [Pisolithus microcarpus]